MSFQSPDPIGSRPPFVVQGLEMGASGRPVRVLPDRLEESLRGAFNRLAGAGLIVLSLLAWTSLLSWSIDDPSLARPGMMGPATNLLGAGGAAISDLLLRGFGLTSVVAIFPLVFWGLMLFVRQRVPQWRLRLLLWACGVLCLSGALATVPLLQAWRIPHGFGGLMGDIVYAMVGGLLGIVTPVYATRLAGLALLAGGGWMLSTALGAGRRELAMLWHGEGWQQAPGRPARTPTTVARAWHGTYTTAQSATGAIATATQSYAPSLRELASNLWRHRPGRQTAPAPRHRPDVNFGTSAPPKPRPLAFTAQRPPTVPPSPPAAGYQPHAMPYAPASATPPYGMPGAMPYPGMPAQPEDMLDATIDLESRAIAERFAPRGVKPLPQQPMPCAPVTPLAPPPPPFTMAGAPPVQMTLPLQQPAPAMRPVEPLPESLPGKPVGQVRRLMKNWKGRSQSAGQAAYRPPSVDMLKRAPAQKPGPEYSQNVQRGVAKLLQDVLTDFGVKGEIQGVKPGPVVTLFELEPARGVKSSRIVGLADDIARSMSATSARVAGIPGRNVIGIELPNMRREMVFLRELLESETYRGGQATLPMVLGKTIGGEPIVADLARMPHVLVAGTTGSGKSVGINSMILSLLYRLGPEQCRFLMIDPKMLELSVYNGIPHLLAPVITEPQKAVAALNWVVREMEERYKRMSQLAVRNIEVFNSRVRQAVAQGEELTRTVQTGFDSETGEPVYETEQLHVEAMPYIVVVVDEMADLMLTAGKEIEGAVQRLAQMARAAGIHLIMATQRPSVDVITGTIKANFPTRVSFKVTSKIDSRTILGEQGAEQLLGAGDMLFSTGTGQIVRVHGPFVSDEEVEQIAAYLRTLGEPAYVDGIGKDADGTMDELAGPEARDDSEDIYDKAVAIVLRDRKASTSYIQRRLSIGYNRAADIMERMEAEGLVSAANAVGKRNILVGEARAS